MTADMRSFLRVSIDELSALIQPLSPGPDQSGYLSGTYQLRDTAGRVLLSSVIEPGDTDAGMLVEALGSWRLLSTIADDNASISADHILPGCSAEDIPRFNARFACALSRWRDRAHGMKPFAVFHQAAHLRAVIVTPSSSLWPTTINDLAHGSPLALWVRGDVSVVPRVRRSISLVGARAASNYGTHVALESAAGMSDRGFAIVSGCAFGIDAAAHRAALASEQVTIAILAGGIDRLYPAGNSELLHRICETGALIAEMAPGFAPTRWRFLMRNRIIAAASRATIVIEAGYRSGSLNTAGHAVEIGRPLGAVPGSVLSPESAGCHRLIREYGAVLVTNIDDMVELADPLGHERES